VQIAFALILAALSPAHRALADVSAEPALADVVSLYMNAQFDAALDLAGKLESQHSADPWPPLIRAHALLWQYEYEGEPPQRWSVVFKALDETIRRASARLRDDSSDAEAEFCWGQALLQSARGALASDSYVTAGSLAKAAAEHLERAHALRPDRVDLRFGLGIYNYYAATLPASLQLFSWLWFVPSGDRRAGIEHLEAVATRGRVFAPDAQTTLLSIRYAEEEGRSTRSLELARELSEKFPGDLLFQFTEVRALFELGRYAEAAGAAAPIVERTCTQASDHLYSGLAAVWSARATLELGDVEAAAAAVERIPAEDRVHPWVESWCVALLGQIEDARGHRSAAVERYQQVLKRSERARSWAAAQVAEAALARPYRPSSPRPTR
jgi:hypothetical protein